MRDVAKLWSAGYALGASLENTLVVSDNRILNPEGLRFPDEFVRHKIARRDRRSGARRRAPCSARTAPCAAATSSTMRCCGADGGCQRLDLVDARARCDRARGHAEVTSRLAPAFGPDVS